MSEDYIKGPWHVRHCDDEMHMCMTAIWASPVPDVNCDQYEDRDCSEAVAIVHHQCYPLVNPDGVDAAAARANIIAAAPELLSALTGLLSKVECGSSLECELCDAARAAIAKAKGHSL